MGDIETYEVKFSEYKNDYDFEHVENSWQTLEEDFGIEVLVIK